MEASDLILTNVAEEKVADDLLAALSDLAYATPGAVQSQPKRKHKSRFFFTLTKSMSSSIDGRVRKFKPRQMVHIDEEVEKRLKVYKDEMPQVLTQNIDQVREFFLTVVGPRSLAGGAGAGQAKEVVQRMLNTEIDGSQFDKFDRMSRAAVNIVMAKFVAQYYGLPVKAAYRILTDILPRPPQTIPVPHEPYESRHARGRKENAERAKETVEKSKEQTSPK